MHISKILVPLDGSSFAEAALSMAWRLAVDTGAALHCVSVAEGKPEPIERVIGYTFVGHESRIEADRSALRSYLDDVEREFSAETLPVKTKVLIGDPATRLIAYAEANACDLIVMATHGRSGVRRWALGSVAEKVVRHTFVPVMLVRPTDSSGKDFAKLEAEMALA